MRLPSTILALFAAPVLLAGCHPGKTPQPTAQDITAVQQEAARELAQARAEASKGLKSAAKVAGPNSREADRAKVIAAYDIAMVKAEGAHKIATEKCLTLAPPVIQACKDQADADFETAKSAAKVTRVARED
ncbi:MAG: hypothetical protein ABSH33_16625 [Steroidobacteraceae bacterium]